MDKIMSYKSANSPKIVIVRQAPIIDRELQKSRRYQQLVPGIVKVYRGVVGAEKPARSVLRSSKPVGPIFLV